MIRDNRRKKRRVKKFLVTLLVFAAILGILALIIINVFTVKDVEVKGNKLYEGDQIEEWVLNDEYSWNSLYVYLKYRFFDMQEVPFIDTIEVGLKTPHTLTIQVYEKGLLGYIYMDSLGQNVYFDKDGFVVETSSEIIEGVPQISGLTCNQVVLYEKLDLENKKALTELLDVTQTLKKYALVPETIAYKNADSIKLSYGAVTVNLGSADNLTEKVKRLEEIMPNIEGMQGTLHMEKWSEETTDITFRKEES